MELVEELLQLLGRRGLVAVLVVGGEELGGGELAAALAALGLCACVARVVHGHVEGVREHLLDAVGEGIGRARGDVGVVAAAELATATGHGAGQGAGKLVSIVADNGTYGTIRMHQERAFPGRVSGSDLRNPDFAALALAYGWRAHRVQQTAQFEPALRAALASEKPTLIHVTLDAEVISPRATITQLRER